MNSNIDIASLNIAELTSLSILIVVLTVGVLVCSARIAVRNKYRKLDESSFGPGVSTAEVENHQVPTPLMNRATGSTGTGRRSP
ncbi:MAG: hypothetical protein ACTHWW_06780 [Arthrobacter sp.]|uniref:hypothetical protein n=1 Tax=unclassified Arthrobacter TaxID=235627 RepID=UPI00264B2C6F|nr:hypothetical protein [Micrococcaceae bacterium]MDN5814204.1 hypothetical protein [Micrococcaceae bacterium]MDN5879693.1 hypothetical protein [Micrococcaceae bacterium]MDN5887114.1 hypothetical protein [Micrococcaceae bacterium]MDN5905032.1 hypothetical protein [Micrococcaceae bacterium]